MPFPSALRRTKPAHRARAMAVATAVATSSMLGLTFAAAAPASAVTGSACTHQVKLDTRVTATVNFRTGPGTGCTSLGLLNKGQGVYWACYKATGATSSPTTAPTRASGAG
ncbi:hypothetical protein [Streptomyces collinus]|uniref:hypothetical protein n=1 Tax=Streptomyces collinus TaxID=42684 RepID=UPI0038204687